MTTTAPEYTDEQTAWIAKRDKLKLKSLIIGTISSALMTASIVALVYTHFTLKPVSLSGNNDDAMNYISWLSVAIGIAALSLVITIIETFTNRSRIKKLGSFPGQRTTPWLGRKLKNTALGLAILDLLLSALMVYMVIQLWS